VCEDETVNAVSSFQQTHMYLLGHECVEWTLLSADVIYIPQVVTSARKHDHSQSWKHKTQRPVFQSVLTVTSVIVLMIVNQG